MFLRKKTLLTMIKVLNGEVDNLKHKVSELESLNKRIKFSIDGNEVGKICLDSITDSIASFDSNGLTVNGEITVKCNEELRKGEVKNEAK